MKKILKLITLILSIAVILSSLASCSRGFTTNEANATIEDFLTKISDGDYSGASALLHPSFTIDLKEYITVAERHGGFDCSEGFEIQDYTNSSYSKNNEIVNGAAYSVTFRAAVGLKLVKVTIEIIKNDAGYGIYTLKLEAIKS